MGLVNTRQPKTQTSLGRIWGANLRARRTQLGLTQVQVAQVAGVTQQAIGHFESGQFVPLDRTKVALARALGTTPGELFPWPDMADLVPETAA